MKGDRGGHHQRGALVQMDPRQAAEAPAVEPGRAFRPDMEPHEQDEAGGHGQQRAGQRHPVPQSVDLRPSQTEPPT